MSLRSPALHRLISRSISLASIGAITLTVAPSFARPKVKPRCVVEFEQAQEKRKQGKLTAAKEQLLACAQKTCGDVVQRECTTLLDQVRLETPSVVFSLTDSAGNQLTDVQVRVKGALIASRLDGRAVSVDPGTYTFFFRTREGQTLEQESTIFEGVSNQRVSAVFPSQEVVAEPQKANKKSAAEQPSNEGAPEVAPAKETPDSESEHESADEGASEPSPQKKTAKKRLEAPADQDNRRATSGGESVLPYVFAGVGVASLGSFFALGALRNSAEGDLKNCWPKCDEGRLDRVKTLAVAANVSLGLSGAAFATGVVLFLSGRSSSTREQAKTKSNTAYAVDVQSFDDGVIAKVSGAF